MRRMLAERDAAQAGVRTSTEQPAPSQPDPRVIEGKAVEIKPARDPGLPGDQW